MKLKFSKMHGLGNDFVVLDGVRQSIDLSPEQLRLLASRNFGVGCDQILLVEKASQLSALGPFVGRVVVIDVTEQQAPLRFVHDQGLTEKHEIRVETTGGILGLRLEADGAVTVDMGVPVFAPEKIPFLSLTDELVQLLTIGNEAIEITAVSMGNPHAVHVVTDIDTAPVASWGPLIESHPHFPQRVNAGFMQIVGRRAIRLRVFERGAG